MSHLKCSASIPMSIKSSSCKPLEDRRWQQETVSLKESYLNHAVRDKSAEGSVAAMSDAMSDLSKEMAAAIRLTIVRDTDLLRGE